MAEGSGSRGGAPSRSSTRASEAGGAAFVHAGRRSLLGRTTDTSSADSFFAAEPPPPNVATAGLRVRQFVRPLLENEELKEAKLAFITAGGTDVPLEREAVRYITNTSSGARGAALCEQLLRLGYYVVYLTSVRAMKPFVRHLLPTHPMPHMLDFISLCTVQHQQKEEGQEEEVEEEEQQPQPIVEEPSSDTDASECEEGVSSPSPPPSSRHLACQTFSAVYEAEEEPDAQVVTSVGSVLKSSDQPTDENAPAEAEPASASPSADAGEVAAAEAAATAAAAEDSAGGELPWRVVLRGPFDTEKGDEEEAADSSGWEFDVREAAAALELYRHCKSRLLCITYRTLVDYAFIVRAVAAGAAPLRERLMFCSAAAVADFYLPYAVMSPHKLKTQQQQQQLAQRPAAAAAEGADTAGPRDMHRGSSRWGSFAAATQPKRWFTGEAEVADTAGTAPGETREGPQQQQLQHQHSSHHHLTLRLWVAPKVLSVVRSVAPECFVVAFKLETDAAHLQECAALYLEPGDSSSSSSSSSSGHGMADCVVGNVLSSRRQTAILFTKGGQRQISFKGKRSHKYFGHGTIEARLAKHLLKLQTLKLKEAFL